MEAINWHIYVQRQPRPALPLSSLKDSKYNNDLDIDSYESLTAFSFFNFPPPSPSLVCVRKMPNYFMTQFMPSFKKRRNVKTVKGEKRCLMQEYTHHFRMA